MSVLVPSFSPASALLSRLAAPDGELEGRLGAAYGEAPDLRARALQGSVRAVERFLETHGDHPAAVFRIPCRISLNPHSEHQGAWVPYGLHGRELYVAAGPAPAGEVSVTNTDPAWRSPLGFSIAAEEERDREAWGSGWDPYLNSPAVTAEVQRLRDPKQRTEDRTGCLNYVKAGVLRLAHLFGDAPGLRITLHGDIPAGGGLSSSSALVVGSLLASLAVRGRAIEPCDLAARAGEAEWFVGTRGGSGDHASMLLGRREGLVHLRFTPPFEVRDIRPSRFPDGYELILANSGVRSEKSAEERLLFNKGIFAYRFAFLALQGQVGSNGAGPVTCLGDLDQSRFSAEYLYRLLIRLPAFASAAELRDQYPHVFPGAARSCFGTDDLERLPGEVPLRGAAAYGLGRVDRGVMMPDLLDAGDGEAMREFGRLMSITHDGDRLFQHGHPYTENLDRLQDARLESLLGNGVLDADARSLRHEPGFYGASTAELDTIVDAALATEGVLGAGLMGAGGGGYVLILAEAGSYGAIRAALEREYYGPTNREPDVETWRPVAAAGRLL